MAPLDAYSCKTALVQVTIQARPAPPLLAGEGDTSNTPAPCNQYETLQITAIFVKVSKEFNQTFFFICRIQFSVIPNDSPLNEYWAALNMIGSCGLGSANIISHLTVFTLASVDVVP